MTVFDSLLLEKGAERISIITFVSDQFRHARDQADAVLGHDAIGGVSRCEDEDPRSTELVNDRMNLAVSAAFGDAYGLGLGPPFPPLAQRWIFTWLLSSATCLGASTGAATAAKMFCQMPRSLQRAKRL